VSEAVYPFEDTGENLSLLPLAARRALDVAGFRLSLEGYQSLSLEDRLELTLAGTDEEVDSQLVEALVRSSTVPVTRIKPAPDPDRDRAPEPLTSAHRRGRPIGDDEWRRLRAIDRYALIHTMRRAIAREDPERLELAIATILGPEFRERPSSLPPSPAAASLSDLPPATADGGNPSGRRAEPARRAAPAAATADGGNPSGRRAEPARRAAPPEALSSPPSSVPARFAPSQPAGVAPAPPSLARGPRRSARPDLPAVTGVPEGPESVSSSQGRASLRHADSERRAGASRLHDPLERKARSAPPPRVDSPLRTSLSSEYAYDRVEQGLSNRPAISVADLDGARPSSGSPLSSHLSAREEVHMVDVGEKPTTQRRASASGTVRMRVETAQRLARNDVPKGEVLAAARIAGILAAKRTPELVPLCHSVALTSVDVLIDVERASGEVHVTAVAEAVDRTGVEMEALTAVSVACLTIYDMLKGIDRDMIISDVKLLSKRGGKRGPYDRRD
jgi:cyclic pyranopterin monophosphate synthase